MQDINKQLERSRSAQGNHGNDLVLIAGAACDASVSVNSRQTMP